MKATELAAEPYSFTLSPDHCALLIIDMQRDFLEPGGFGEMLGNDVSQLAPDDRAEQSTAGGLARRRACCACTRAKAIGPTWPTCRRPRKSAAAARPASATPGRWAASWCAARRVTTSFPSCIRAPGEPVIDKPGKGAFYATDLHAILQHRGIKQLVVHRRHHRGLRQHHGARGQRPRLRLPRARGLRRLLLPGVPGHGPEDDQGAGRHLRLGCRTLSRVIEAPEADLNRRRRSRAMTRCDHDLRQPKASGSRATGTPSSASGPTSWSICWC